VATLNTDVSGPLLSAERGPPLGGETMLPSLASFPIAGCSVHAFTCIASEKIKNAEIAIFPAENTSK